jgi:UDP-4-amino-4,6-dideoxy-N-acetyl-beta-L-altrosamine transaminase
MSPSSAPPFLPYGRQSIDEADIQAVVDVLRGDWLTTGPAVDRFETALSDACDGAHAVVVANGTVALQVVMHSLGVGPGTTVVVPAVTFMASANAARYLGADVVFADVDPNSGLMTPETCAAALDRAPSAVRAIVPVHLGGRIVDLAGLGSIADTIGAEIVEDACHALGGSHGPGDQGAGRPVGSCAASTAAIFSFHPVKTVTSGEGGAVMCPDADRAQMMRRLRHHGISTVPEEWENKAEGFTNRRPNPWYHEMRDLGYNFRLTDIHCALGASQMAKLRRFVNSRNDVIDAYDAALEEAFPGNPHSNTTQVRSARSGTESARGWHLYQAMIDFPAHGTSRAAVMTRLKEKGIGTQVHYIPVPWQPYYRRYAEELGDGDRAFPGAADFYHRALSLPLSPTMEPSDACRVVADLKSALAETA